MNNQISILERLTVAEDKGIFPHTKDKILVDFVNGLEPAKNWNEESKEKTTLLARIWDLSSGKGKMRQDNINDQLLSAWEAAGELISELATDITQHGVALIKIEQALSRTQNKLIFLGEEVLKIEKELLEQLADVRSDLQEITLDQRAQTHMSQITSAWKAGKYAHLSALARCFLAFDTLRWGAFGDRMRQGKAEQAEQKLLEHLENEVIICLKNDFQVSKEEPLTRKDWLALPNPNEDTQAILQFQGDFSYRKPTDFAYAFMATQWDLLSEEQRNQEEYKLIPFHIQNIEHVAKRMNQEFFEGSH